VKYPNPMCAVIDLVVTLAKGGHPSLIENLQLAHMSFNRIKSDKLFADNSKAEQKTLVNRNLPQSRDWSQFISVKSEGG
ncbi:HNH endonuclease, partial [Streptococcus suis]